MGRNNRKIITRDKIMRAAVAQFAEKGYDAASIQSIVEDADVAHGTIFWHFGNKEKLYMEVSRWAGNQFYDAMRQEVEREGPPPTLVELALKQYAYLKKNPQIGRLSMSIVYEAIGPHPELAPAMRQFNRRITDVWRQWGQRCAEAGLLRPGFNADMVGYMVSITLAGVNVSSHMHGWENARSYFETIAQIFASGCFTEEARMVWEEEVERARQSVEPPPRAAGRPALRPIAGGRST
jgi:AcrR family transcriptional regulator